MTLSIFIISAVIIGLCIFVAVKGNNSLLNKIARIGAIVYFVCVCSRFFIADNFMEITTDVTPTAEQYSSYVYQVILRWGLHFSVCIIPIAAFFPCRVFKNASYLSVIFGALNAISIKESLALHITNDRSPVLLSIFLCIEFILLIVLPVIISLANKHRFAFADGKEWLALIVFFVVNTILSMPAESTQALFGYAKGVNNFYLGSGVWFVWVVVSLLVLIGSLLYFKNKSLKLREAVVWFAALKLFFYYITIFEKPFGIVLLPVQLCNIASVTCILALLLNSKKLFDFIFYPNLLGVLIAYLFVGADGGLCNFWGVHFMYQHLFVLVTPVLMCGLGVFGWPKGRSTLKNMFVGLTIYFVCCSLFGTIVNCAYERIYCNWFYMFSASDVERFVPFLSFLVKWAVPVGAIEIYPALQLFIYVVFSAMVLGFYYLLQLCRNLVMRLARTPKESAL